jgi:uncharacterized phage protein gp47/JayE
MGTLNQTGYQTTTYAEKRAALATVFKNAFGSNLNTDPQTPQGNIIDYVTSLVDNEDKIGLSFFNQLNYRNATGALLSAIAVSKGQPRKNGTKAVITCTFTSSSSPYSIAANSIFVDNISGLQFTNTAIVNITSNSQSVELIALIDGATGLVPTNTLSAQSYVAALSNIEITVISDGTNAESDANLIFRLSSAEIQNARNDVDSIVFYLNALEDTTRVSVLNNPTNSTDANGVPAHSINAIVVGALDNDIANIIFQFKASGTPTFGSTNVIVLDSQGYPETIHFDRALSKSIYARISITQRQGVPINGNLDLLLQTTMDYINSLRIGDDVSRTPIFGIWGDGNFDIVDVELSFDNITYVSTNLAIGIREYAFVSNLNQINYVVV